MAPTTTSATFLARILGPYILIIGASVLVRREALTGVLDAFVGDPALIFVTGALVLLVGLVLVAVHNRWRTPGEAAVSLVAWIITLRGAALLLAPDLIIGLARSAVASGLAVIVAGVVAILIGLGLTVFGYRRKSIVS